MAALSLFFKAEQIFVTGTSRYSQQQVLQASGIRQGGNLFLLNKHQAAASITEQLPYVESVRIRRQLPNALHIEITECAHPLALEQDGAVWLLNGSGTLREQHCSMHSLSSCCAASFSSSGASRISSSCT